MKRYIKSNSESEDVFMLMQYIPDYSGDMGMAGDKFDCFGKFYSSSLASAKREYNEVCNKYPHLKGSGIYVTSYNSYFDSFPKSENDIDMNPSAWGGAKYNVFPDVETLIQYYGLDKDADEYPNSYYGDSEGLPFEI